MNFKTLTLLSLIALFSACQNTDSELIQQPAPTNGMTEIYDGQDESDDARNRRLDYEEMIHQTAAGVDWRAMDRQTQQQQAKAKHLARKNTNQKSIETFANGALKGEWQERGSNNQAGNLSVIDYDANQEAVYGISGGGTLWKGDLHDSNWMPLNEDLQFSGRVLQVLQMPNNGKRIIAAQGKILYYSDDEGSTWTESTGFDFWSDWGHPLELVKLGDANNTLYYQVFTWSDNPWGSRVWLMASTDQGATFSLVKSFDHDLHFWSAQRFTDMVQPLDNSTDLYVVHLGRELYKVSGTTITKEHDISTLPTDAWIDLEGHGSGNDLILYALSEQKNVYRSTDKGATWTFMGTNNEENAWNVGLEIDIDHPEILYIGGVDTHRSLDGGASWEKLSHWGDYYGDPLNNIHADIMDITSFRDANNTSFTLTANHGGLNISTDQMKTQTNISMEGLNIAQYYDAITDPINPNYVYAGTQDQGHQRASTAQTAGVLDFQQVISGDYGYLRITNEGQNLWSQYPGGAMSFYANARTGNVSRWWTLESDNEAAGGWIAPTADTADPDDNAIYLAGGNIHGGAGSYLIKLTATLSPSINITPYQYDYDFRANANEENATISAIAESTIDANRLYVGTSDGAFFYSNNAGTNWAKSAAVDIFSAHILPSTQTSNLLYVGGSGYSNAAVRKSTDGGQTFTDMSNGLPSTLVRHLAANEDESMLFAATDVGPYVYITADDQWYDLRGIGAPMQSYRSVEFLADQQIVRFATYGRGLWDFAIDNTTLYAEISTFTAKATTQQTVQLTWTTAVEIDHDYFEVERSADAQTFKRLSQINSTTRNNAGNSYEYLDQSPTIGSNYYRLKQVDQQGKITYSDVRQVRVYPDYAIDFYPNPVQSGGAFTIRQNLASKARFRLVDRSGKILVDQILSDEETTLTIPEVATGIYYYQVVQEGAEAVKQGALMIR